jgi:homoserine O-acetyltransferase/O-succinyltransferase
VPSAPTADPTLRRAVLATPGDPLPLSCGRTLDHVEVVYTAHGPPDADEVVLVCHALTGDAQPTGPDGWWPAMVGPGRPIDTDRFLVLTPNLLGGCRGTTGPSSIDPGTAEPYGLDFPPLAVEDLVTVHRRLLRHLEIDRVHTAIGGSLGGMQVLEWLLAYPGEVERGAIIAASARLSAQNIALTAIAREAIMRDPDFRDGDYLRQGTRPALGLSIARRLAHITYLSAAGMAEKFARDEPEPAPPDDARAWLATRYDVEGYLDHQAASFLERFDALSYLYLTRIMDAFDPFATPRRADADARALVVAFDTDWRFGPDHARVIADGLRRSGAVVEEALIASTAGHDAFLLDVPDHLAAVRAFVAG